jgi:GNAT superfamily N-acetyltransferase
VLRASVELPFRRCNCAIPLAGAGPAPLDEIEAFYSSRALPPRVQVTTATPRALDDALAARGYEIEAPVDVLVATLDVTATGNVECEVTRPLDAAWAELYAALHDGDERVAAYGRMLAQIGPAAFAVTALVEGAPAGMGFGVVERGWCGIFGMTTLPDARRRGVATAVLSTVGRVARDLDASTFYLQVERDNGAARALYEGVAFAYEYGYHYRTLARV